MIEFLPIDLSNSEHGAFVYDVMKACEKELLDDFDNDIILLIEELEALIRIGDSKGFIVLYDGNPIGIIHMSIDRYQIGCLHGGMLPEYANGLGRKAYKSVKKFIQFAFENFKIRKIKAEIPTYNRKAERILLGMGFKKEGLFLEQTIRNGKPENVVSLQLLKSAYYNREKMNGN